MLQFHQLIFVHFLQIFKIFFFKIDGCTVFAAEVRHQGPGCQSICRESVRPSHLHRIRNILFFLKKNSSSTTCSFNRFNLKSHCSERVIGYLLQVLKVENSSFIVPNESFICSHHASVVFYNAPGCSEIISQGK